MSDPGPAPPPDYVTAEQLSALLYPTGSGPQGDPNRPAMAAAAANALVAQWTPQDPEGTPAPVGPITSQVALELAQTLYRRHAATGGLVDLDVLVARIPADLVRGLRDELDAASGAWGLA